MNIPRTLYICGAEPEEILSWDINIGIIGSVLMKVIQGYLHV